MASEPIRWAMRRRPSRLSSTLWTAASRRVKCRTSREHSPGKSGPCSEKRPAMRPASAARKERAMDPSDEFLLTDLYQLAMMEAYVANGETETAVFEFFVRKLPPRRGFFLAAGLEQVLCFLEGLRVSQADLEWLARSGRFGDAFLDYLSRFRFTGDVHAMPEGTAFFPDEPIIRITAPLPEAQYVESRIINILQFQTMIASRA